MSSDEDSQRSAMPQRQRRRRKRKAVNHTIRTRVAAARARLRRYANDSPDDERFLDVLSMLKGNRDDEIDDLRHALCEKLQLRSAESLHIVDTSDGVSSPDATNGFSGIRAFKRLKVSSEFSTPEPAEPSMLVLSTHKSNFKIMLPRTQTINDLTHVDLYVKAPRNLLYHFLDRFNRNMTENVSYDSINV